VAAPANTGIPYILYIKDSEAKDKGQSELTLYQENSKSINPSLFRNRMTFGLTLNGNLQRFLAESPEFY
jgi:hypothetical protein